MADYYTIITPSDLLKCTQAQAERIQKALAPEDTGDPSEHEDHGFQFDFMEVPGFAAERGDKITTAGFFGAEMSGQEDLIQPEALRLIGELIRENGMPFLLMGVALTCSKQRVNSHGGHYFRIYPDGTIEHPVIAWPRETGILESDPITDATNERPIA